ncbi:aspartate dehydrogenase [Phaeobacter italicus]|uniref:aspartate dehydrogenase n=1 Tax=Phaeobacter italicus TaxID=481446 RepID=UPI001CD5195B|nr:aspartate dehydrogenase [Phaeobacter italicus]MCA0858873.1 aspartate dehydrogenase [Phaeobacter italicus]
MKIALIGFGTIARYVVDQLASSRIEIAAVIVPEYQIAPLSDELGKQFNFITEAAEAGNDIDLFVDCAGHGALLQHGAQILRAGHDLLTVSIGALADAALLEELDRAAAVGGGSIRLVSGAIGALDALRASRTGTLQAVRYIGRKPPQGWIGSQAEQVLDLSALAGAAQVHFRGTAREAALQYPKNANVAAAVALAGIGLDNTQVELLADPSVSRNIHEIEAEGDFGSFRFSIEGNPLPSNPRTSSLAAMSVIASIKQYAERIKF